MARQVRKRPSSKTPADEQPAAPPLKIDRRRMRRALRRFVAGEKSGGGGGGETLTAAAAVAAAGKTTTLIVKVALLGGAHFPRLVAHRFDPVAGKKLDNGTAVRLVLNDKVYEGTFQAETGQVYVLYCEYEGPPKSGLEVTVFYPPDSPGRWPPDVGKDAGKNKFEAPGQPRPFLVRVPTAGVLQ